ncbi:Uncharacterized protein TCM_004347 [Theobroma cacao]|uniref:Uncharacterized protein n=1 Tax=Theobroma cacao TaxID=3641 RepID=A0A061DQR6_THECC|nr:Uncharacterized protein TCM_004347 [Theobroma cacao]
MCGLVGAKKTRCFYQLHAIVNLVRVGFYVKSIEDQGSEILSYEMERMRLER